MRPTSSKSRFVFKPRRGRLIIASSLRYGVMVGQYSWAVPSERPNAHNPFIRAHCIFHHRKALIHNSHPKTRSREITHHTVTAAPKIGTTSPIGLRHATLGPTAKSTERLRDVAPSSEVIIVNIFPSAYQKYSVEGAEKNVHSAKNDTLTRTHRH